MFRILVGKPKRGGEGHETLVARPYPCRSVHRRGGEQMRIDLSDPASHQAMPFDEKQNSIVAGARQRWRGPQQAKDFAARRQGAARQFPDHKAMRATLTGFQMGRQRVIAPTQVIDPGGGVDEDHPAFGRRRDVVLRLGSLPPSRARQRADSRSIKALSASRSREPRAFTPLCWWAWDKSSSSRFKVVRMEVSPTVEILIVASLDAPCDAYGRAPGIRIPRLLQQAGRRRLAK